MVIDIPVLLNNMLVFGADFIIDNLEVDLVASQSEAVHYGIVGYNMIIFLLGLNRSYNNGVGVLMVGGQDVSNITAILDVELPSVVRVELQGWFGPNVHFFERMRGKGTKNQA